MGLLFHDIKTKCKGVEDGKAKVQARKCKG
jgi:hypothetical protein